MSPPVRDALHLLARAHGVATSYTTDRGVRTDVSPDTLIAVLAACGVEAATPAAASSALAAHEQRRAARLLPPCVVRTAAESLSLDGLGLPHGTEAYVELEDGAGSVPVTAARPAGLPVGLHTLHVAGAAESAPLLIAPERVTLPQGRHWGFLVQLYSTLSRRSWGMGDLGDLAELAEWSAREHGAGFVQLGPLHAAVPGPLTDPSPYRPSSRRFPDPLHLRVEAVREYAYLPEEERRAVDACAGRARALNGAVLNGSSLIDRDTVRTLKLTALRRIHAAVPLTPGRAAAFDAFVRREGRDLTDFATWCALAEVHGDVWRSWPAGLRDPRSGAVERARAEHADAVAFHRWLAWVTDEQLADAQHRATAAGMPIGLVHDLAVGVAPDGADSWAYQDFLASGMSVGAPPDDFNARGQDWSQPPWRPDALRAAGCRPLAGVLRAGLRHAGALRVDHVMGLFRLWWIPEGRPPAEGTYVRYDGDALLGTLLTEAHRAGAAVIGEDLGTVEAGVRERLARRGVLGTSVQRFEYVGGSEGRHGPLPARDWRPDCLATLTTHDLPGTAAWLSGEHVELRSRLGLLTRPEPEEKAQAAAERDGWLAELARSGLLADGDPGPEAALLALHRFLLSTPSRLLGVWLPDAVGDRRPQNLPGTSDVHPNWRLPVADGAGRPVPLEELADHPLVRKVTGLFAALSGRSDEQHNDPENTENTENAEDTEDTEETDARPAS
ncbi:4-alpha-glucanotransferase [Streptomyces sp. VRA16 Mangrove soil]|uniref:4-alpha-glucanotransferase n=1 Tax=Streptomyces sp. VRA16 Mangrove soil TaxID=2817434 RepID=UPI001A9CDB7E|nr:4-alpha-glucanotransferase [Streptomyces sp. VRA16 Mangrove soil]MBO1334470.1 4-alpha-glucanotransferase [Streptomyces sp. VRA16 Mangrove soil]